MAAHKTGTKQHLAPLPPAPWDATQKRQLRRRLLAWYGRSARVLPWRANRDPYRVWVSEIMLQQTQVATVEAYFKRFTARFPTVTALARADEDDVLRLWEGLGYYRRARQLHQAAQHIATRHGGRFPREMDAIRALPGIGRYTAGAVASIAFDQREPIVEANTVRLLTRLLAYEGDPAGAAGQRLLWTRAADLLPRKEVGRFNQALMELGSLVCTPKNPGCEECPLALHCVGRAAGLQHDLPRLRPKPTLQQVHEAAVVVRRRGHVLLMRRQDGERWAGLCDFPRFALRPCRGAELQEALVAGVQTLTGVRIEPREHLTTMKHGVTRYRITLHCHAARYVSSSGSAGQGRELQWIAPADLHTIPLNTTGRKLSRWIVGEGKAG